MNNTNLLGTITEMKCITYFMELGYTVSIPQNPCRYDFIIDVGDKMLRVQVKTCNTSRRPGGITFSTCSSHYVKGIHTHTTYKFDNIDYFCTYYENECYLVPVSECGSREKCLHFGPMKNGQVKNISFVKDYIAREVIKK